MNYLILENVPKPPCVTTANTALTCEPRIGTQPGSWKRSEKMGA